MGNLFPGLDQNLSGRRTYPAGPWSAQNQAGFLQKKLHPMCKGMPLKTSLAGLSGHSFVSVWVARNLLD
jgi:hypothetical protein